MISAPCVQPVLPVDSDSERHRRHALHLRWQQIYRADCQRPDRMQTPYLGFLKLVADDDTGELEPLTCAMD
ncbi:MAG: hypothetical protein ACI8P0_002890 [Planctomycetaceae bacterium]|jgi:hypothetical protein